MIVTAGLPFLRGVRVYKRGDFLYFINTHAVTWLALPQRYAKTLLVESGNETHSESYIEAYNALAKSGMIRDSRFPRKTASPAPKMLLVKLQNTGKCNLNCAYCFNNPGIRSRIMEEATMRQAVDYAFSNPYAANGIYFVIYGGEPLMERELLYDTVRYIRSKNSAVYIGIITNGVLLTAEDIAFFQTNGVEIMISFDGLPVYQNQNRPALDGSPQAEKILKNMERLREFHYMSHSHILCTVTHEMSAHLLDIALFLQSHGISTLEFLPLRMLGCASGQANMSVDVGAYITSLKEIIEAIEDGKLSGLRVRTILRMLLPLVTGQTVHGPLGNYRCSAGRNSIFIHYDGRISGCDMIPEDISPVIGDVWRGVTDIGKLDDLILPLARASAACRKCPWFRFCRSGCPGASASDGKSCNERHTLTCAVNRAIYPVLLEKLTVDGGKMREYFRKHTSTVSD